MRYEATDPSITNTVPLSVDRENNTGHFLKKYIKEQSKGQYFAPRIKSPPKSHRKKSKNQMEGQQGH